MVTSDAQTQSQLVPIAPAPLRNGSNELDAEDAPPQSLMSYTCQSCAKRKVKCDRAIPSCLRCRKANTECLYQAPVPRGRKRKLSGEVIERLALYERILNQNGLLPQEDNMTPSSQPPPEVPSPQRRGSEVLETGRLLTDPGKSRYMDSNLWHSLGEDEMHNITDEEDEDKYPGFIDPFSSDPLTGAFLGSSQSLVRYHPTHVNAMALWRAHVENVEPICKILHIPSTSTMIEAASQQPTAIPKASECLMFAIYHFAVTSMTDEECLRKFEESRRVLMERYHFATRQALVNASFLKTTEMTILQALVLFLLNCRYTYDPQTYWILTGVAVRIAQRMGLHRDGAKMGMSPFDVHMRRRLFYQLLPLDGVAGQMSGPGLQELPKGWELEQPSNINDDQIWPGMVEAPEVKRGATEMIFCLTRSSLGKCFLKTGGWMQRTSSGKAADYDVVERVIREAESEIEENFIRYCDIISPIHILTISLARAGIASMRIRACLNKIRNRPASDEEKNELLQLSQKIMDTDSAAYAQPSLRRFSWHIGPFFLWGSWDSLVFVLSSIWRSNLPSTANVDDSWRRVEQVYNNHGEFLESKGALHMAFGRLTLKAWAANPPIKSTPEPQFITTLRNLQRRSRMSRSEKERSAGNMDGITDSTSSMDLSPASDADALLFNLPNDIGLDIGKEFNLDAADWLFWDTAVQQGQEEPHA